MVDPQQSDPRTTLAAWLEAGIAKAEDDARRAAKRDGVPTEWIETVLAKLRREKAGVA